MKRSQFLRKGLPLIAIALLLTVAMAWRLLSNDSPSGIADAHVGDLLDRLTAGQMTIDTPSQVVPPFEALRLKPERLVLPVGHGDTLVELSSGLQIEVPAGAFVDASGRLVRVPVELALTEYHHPLETWLGGVPMTIEGDRVLRSAGMMEVRARRVDAPVDRPEELQLQSGKSLTLMWPSVTDAEGYNAWELDEESGNWSNRGSDPVQLTAFSASKIQDQIDALPPLQLKPVPSRNNSFTLGDETGEFFEIAPYEGWIFQPTDDQICGSDATSIVVEPVTDGLGGAFLVHFNVHWEDAGGRVLLDTVNTCRCDIAVPPGPLFERARRAFATYMEKEGRARLRAEDRLKNELRRAYLASSRQLLARQLNRTIATSRPVEALRKAISAQRSLRVDQLGWVNIDIPVAYPSGFDDFIAFTTPDLGPLEVAQLSIIEVGSRTLFPCVDGRVRFDPDVESVLVGVTSDGSFVYARHADLGHFITERPRALEVHRIPPDAISSADFGALILGG